MGSGLAQRRRNIDNWGGQIFIYSCSAQLISFEIDCFYSLWTRIYEYLPPLLSIFRRLWSSSRPHGMLGLIAYPSPPSPPPPPLPPLKSTTWCIHENTYVLVQLCCMTHPIFPFITLPESFCRNIAMKGTWHRDEWLSLFQFYRETFLQSVDPDQHIITCQNFTLIYHLTFPKGPRITFHYWRCKKMVSASMQKAILIFSYFRSFYAFVNYNNGNWTCELCKLVNLIATM